VKNHEFSYNFRINELLRQAHNLKVVGSNPAPATNLPVATHQRKTKALQRVFDFDYFCLKKPGNCNT
jgi:hypothetical protein